MHVSRATSMAVALMGFALQSLAVPAAAEAGTTELISRHISGMLGTSSNPSLSADGRFVAFHSDAPDLVPDDTNASSDIFVLDRQTQVMERISVNVQGLEGDAGSFFPAISADGRWVVFVSLARNLVPDDTNDSDDMFLFDRQNRTIERVNLSSAGEQANAGSRFAGGFSGFLRRPAISPNGRVVAFHSSASNLVLDDTNELDDLFVRNLETRQTERVNVTSQNTQTEGDQTILVAPGLSGDGRFVVFTSTAKTLVPNDTNNDPNVPSTDVFVRDRLQGTTVRVNVSSNGEQTELGLDSVGSAISRDGRFVAFVSGAANLVPNDTNRMEDYFVRDLRNGTTERVSVDSNGAQAENLSDTGAFNLFESPSISADGRFVAFTSFATTLVPGDTNGDTDIFVRDRRTGSTERVNVTNNGEQTAVPPPGGNFSSGQAVISADGRVVAFRSSAANLMTRENFNEVFVRTRELVAVAEVNALSLTPRTAKKPVGSEACVLAFVTDTNDAAATNIDVSFSISGQVKAPTIVQTDARGQAKFCYLVAELPGTSTVTAVAQAGTNPQDTATVTVTPPQSTEGCRLANAGTIRTQAGAIGFFSGSASVIRNRALGEQRFESSGPSGIRLISTRVDAISCSAGVATIFGLARRTDGSSVGYRIDLKDSGLLGFLGLGNDLYRLRLTNGYDSGGLSPLTSGNISIVP